MKHSFITQKLIPTGEEVIGSEIRDVIFEFIQSTYPSFGREDFISIFELNQFRRLYLTYLVSQEKSELTGIEKDVMNAINNNNILSDNIEIEMDEDTSMGQRIADKVATFGGSWTFILSFFFFIVFWMILNSWLLSQPVFDPYPFILLNLILSCLAAIQAPIIMMSQNRQEQKDRQRAEHDYKINLKAELEIKLLSEKMDHLLVHQNKKLLEIQEIQIDYLDDLMKEFRKK